MRFDLTTPIARPADCAIHVAAIEDKRSQRDRFGSSPDFKLFAEHVPEWFAAGMKLLNSADHALTMGVRPTVAPKIELAIQLNQAYMHHNSTAKNANIVVTVDYRQAGWPAETKLYRGLDTSINWASSPSEVEAAMNRALSQVLTDIATDLRERCKPGIVHKSDT